MNMYKRIQGYITNVLNGMAYGLFSSLLIGLIIKQIGALTGIELLSKFGSVAQNLMGPAIGVGVAYVLKAPSLIVMASSITGAIGAGTFIFENGQVLAKIGEPVGAFIAALLGVEVAKRFAGKTKVDIVLLPLITIIVGGLVGTFISPALSAMMKGLGELINRATELRPVPMGIIISVLMGIILTLPISSAAIAISLNLSGLAAGAATVGCCANMIGFAVISYKANGLGGFIAQGIGTSMLQMPNIIKKPIIWLPAIISSAILGPVSSSILKMTSSAKGAGMGTSGLVGQFAMIEVMGNNINTIIEIALMHFILPGIISYLVYKILIAKGLIKDEDLLLEKIK